MTKFVRNSRLKRVVSAMCSVALLASLVVVPAYATVPGSVTSYTLNGNLTAAEGVNNDGIRGTLTLETTGTPALQASQESTATYQSEVAQGATMASLGVTNTAGDFALRVAIFNGQNPTTSFPTTDIPVPGISVSTTITGVVAAINAAISGLPADLRGTAFITPSGRIRVLMSKAQNEAEIWVHSGPALVPGDRAAFTEVTDPVGLSLAEAVFGGNNPWGRGSGPADSYRVGTGNLGYSAVATWSPLSPVALNIPVPAGAFQFGSFDNGVVDYDNFVSAPDTATGLFTAVMANRGDGSYALAWTAGRSTPIVPGVSQLVFGTGVADPSYEEDCEGSDAPEVFPSVVPTVGAVATWTVDIDDPDGTRGYWNWRENSYNGVSILIPNGFELVSAPDHPAFLPALVASLGSTPTVETTVTSEGTLVTLSNFVDDLIIGGDTDDGMTFQLALKAPTTAGPVGVGAKIWTHAVGTPWTANPMVTQLIDPAYPDSNSDGIPDTDWFPLFCRCGNVEMSVAPDVIKTVTLAADVNRAQGYTALVASAKDQYGNDVSAFASYSNPTITGTSDGANWANYSTGMWVWQYAKTPGVNTASVVVDDTRTTANENLTASVSNNTSGIGEPAKVVILPTQNTWADGSTPSFQIQLQDANGNPTSWLDKHSISTDWFQLNAHSQNNPFPAGLAVRNRYIWRGWSKSSGFSGSGGSLFGPDTTDLNAWPTTFTFGMSANGPDTWTITAKHRSGSVMPAAFATVDITAEDPAIAGVPVGFKVTASKQAPAEYADGDGFYNNKADGYQDDAFGYAAAGGEDKVVLTARVVDAYGNTITNGTANIPVRFEIPKFDRVNAIMPTGHVYETTTDANGVATVEVKSFEPTLNRRWAPSPIGTLSWFTPVRVTTTVSFGGADWANPCGTSASFEGYGFTYFHGAKVSAGLAQTPECEDKDIVLADGTDTTGWEVEVLDSAFNTPIANWDLKFTTSLGSFANGAQAVEVKTDANGKASAPVKSSTAGTAYLRVFDRWRNAFTTGVDFTDYVAKQTIANSTARAGDRAAIETLVYFENIKTGQRVQWSADSLYDYLNSCVYGPSLPNNCEDTCAVTHTNDAEYARDECGEYEVDTDNNGKMDAIRYAIPAYDENDDRPLESAGMRYMLPHGEVSADTWFNNVFYDNQEFVVAPARPVTQVNFVKEATLSAEGTQLDDALNLVGSGFTPAHVSDRVEIWLGDITTHGRGQDNWVGYAYVGADGSLMPTAVFNGVGQIAPGEYDITVDGLVFKKGLVIKNLFNQAEIRFRDIAARSGDQIYINGAKNNTVQVDAYGALNTEVWMGGVKLANSSATGNFVIPAGKFSPGKYTVTAKVMWPTLSAASDYYGRGYTTVVKRDVYVQGPLKFGPVAMSASGRTVRASGKVTGAAEWNGSKAFAVRVAIQRLVNGRWTTVTTKTVRANATTGNYAASVRVSSAGTYRAVVSHKDLAHPASSRVSGSRVVR